MGIDSIASEGVPEGTGTLAEIDRLVAGLDAKWGPGAWDFYRTGLRQWVGHVRDRMLHPEPKAVDLLSDCLSGLLSCREVVAVPPVPRRSVWSVGKDGTGWCVLCNDRPCIYNLKTKKLAEQSQESCSTLEARSVDEWHQKWDAFVASRVEGVDFVYRS